MENKIINTLYPNTQMCINFKTKALSNNREIWDLV